MGVHFRIVDSRNNFIRLRTNFSAYYSDSLLPILRLYENEKEKKIRRKIHLSYKHALLIKLYLCKFLDIVQRSIARIRSPAVNTLYSHETSFNMRVCVDIFHNMKWLIFFAYRSNVIIINPNVISCNISLYVLSNIIFNLMLTRPRNDLELRCVQVLFDLRMNRTLQGRRFAVLMWFFNFTLN